MLHVQNVHGSRSLWVNLSPAAGMIHQQSKTFVTGKEGLKKVPYFSFSLTQYARAY